ncbi:MAG: hypothetical protein AB1512_24155 [Thermodesulfobacteriota bacterium]
MKKIYCMMTCLALVLLTASLAVAGEVAQGKCLSFDPKAMVIVIEEYDIQFSKEHPYGRPTGKQSTYKASDAQIGIMPEKGDILRIAFEVKGSDRLARKVMNVSKQDLMKK